MAIAPFFLSHLPKQPVGIQRPSNKTRALPPRKPQPRVCDGHSPQWSTSPAIHAGEESSKARVKTRFWAQSWLARAYAGSRATIAASRTGLRPAQNIGLLTGQPRADAITTPLR